jgi:hypothetical protein
VLLGPERLKWKPTSAQDFRNYRVSVERAEIALGFEPQHFIEDIEHELSAHRAEYGYFEDDRHYNIRVLKKLALEKRNECEASAETGLLQDRPPVRSAPIASRLRGGRHRR